MGSICFGDFDFGNPCDTCLGFLEVDSSRLCCFFSREGEFILLFRVCFDFGAPDSELEDVPEDEEDCLAGTVFLVTDLGFGTGGQMYKR